MANWIEVNSDAFNKFLRAEREANGTVHTADIKAGRLRIFYIGGEDYRSAQWIAKRETTDGVHHFFLTEPE